MFEEKENCITNESCIEDTNYSTNENRYESSVVENEDYECYQKKKTKTKRGKKPITKMDTIDEENSSNLSKDECLLSEGKDSPESYFDHPMRSIFNVINLLNLTCNTSQS